MLAGRARFTLAGEDHDAPAGTAVFIRDPAVRRGAVAGEAGTTVLVGRGCPGPGVRALAVGGVARGVPLLRSGRSTTVPWRSCTAAWPSIPTIANVLYNTACMEALAGEHDAALEHLARAIELNPPAREWARGRFGLRPDSGRPALPRLRDLSSAYATAWLRRASRGTRGGCCGGARRALAGRKVGHGTPSLRAHRPACRK